MIRRRITRIALLAALLWTLPTTDTRAVPGVDSCTAALIGFSYAQYLYDQCLSDGTFDPCAFEYIAVEEARDNVLAECNIAI